MAVYNIVEFLDNSVGIVSSKWLNEDSSMNMWPPYNDPGKIKAALVMHDAPMFTWTAHQIKILATAGIFFLLKICKEFTMMQVKKCELNEWVMGLQQLH